MTADPALVTRNSYDHIAGQYAVRNAQRSSDVDVALDRFVTELLGKLVADVGCGPGRDARTMRMAGLTVVGFDYSHGMLAAGNTAGVVQADAHHLPVADNTFDGVWCQALLNHMEPAPVIPELVRILKPGGLLHVGTRIAGDARWWCTDYDGDHPRWFVNGCTGDELVALMISAGLRVLKVRRIPSPFGSDNTWGVFLARKETP